jgi:hypothetical protein
MSSFAATTNKECRDTSVWVAKISVKLALFAALLLSFVSITTNAQEIGGSVSGVVVNTWNGTPLVGVVVTVRGTTLAAQTDLSGRYELKNVPTGDQVLRFSKAGFASTVVTDVRVLPGQTTTVNGNLRPEFFEMEEFEVTAEQFQEQTEKILFERQQSGALLDAIGSEQFSKLGASDAGQIISRVSGISVVGGKYAVVRGLSDRYTRTLLNGVEVPSADPYRTSPQLDLFPSAMIDHVSVSKTFTPDQPGGTGGGTIDIATKSFPEKPFVKAKVETSYNPNSNLKDNFLADPKSKTDMFSFPSGPKSLDPRLFGLTGAPPPPGPASRRETQDRANMRAGQADATQDLLQSLGTANFAGTSKDSPLNSSFDVSAGTTVPVFEHPFGVFAGLNYKRNFYLLDDVIVRRYNPNGSPDLLGHMTRGNIDTDYGANVNLGYSISPHTQFGFNFMLVHSTDEEARHTHYDFVEGREDTLEKWQIRYTDREIRNYQINGHHEWPSLADSKLDWVAGISDTSQDEPDNRFLNYFVSPANQPQFGDSALPTPQFPARYFREINEHAFTYRLDYTLPLKFMPEESKFKGGWYSSVNDRDFREQYFAYNLSDGFDVNNPNSYLNDPAYLRYTVDYLGGIRTNYNFRRYIGNTFAAPYTASLEVTAGYLMADLGVTPWLRLIGGARFEDTLMTINAKSGGSVIDQADVLPAASAVLTLYTNLDLRLSYGETVARPSFREKAPVLNFLPDEDVIAFGNPDLQMSAIRSYDARLEWFPSPGDVISAGVFYKEIERPIELFSRTLTDDVVTWINRTNGTAKLMGVEFEARKSMEFLTDELKGLSLGANVTLIKSSTKLDKSEISNKRAVDPKTPGSRPLYSQSPYIINLDLTYAHPTSGTTLAVGANLTGERLIIAKAQGPDVYEHPPVTLDAAITQKFWKHWTARFAVKNILDPNFKQTYGDDDGGRIYQSYQRGRSYNVSLTLDF